MKQAQVNYSNMTDMECMIQAVKQFYSTCKGVTDVIPVREYDDYKQIRLICNDMQDILLDITLFNSKNKYEDYNRYYLVKQYRLSVSKVVNNHDIYEFERIEGFGGFFMFKHKGYMIDFSTENPFEYSKLECETIFREHEIQQV